MMVMPQDIGLMMVERLISWLLVICWYAHDFSPVGGIFSNKAGIKLQPLRGPWHSSGNSQDFLNGTSKVLQLPHGSGTAGSGSGSGSGERLDEDALRVKLEAGLAKPLANCLNIWFKQNSQFFKQNWFITNSVNNMELHHLWANWCQWQYWSNHQPEDVETSGHCWTGWKLGANNKLPWHYNYITSSFVWGILHWVMRFGHGASCYMAINEMVRRWPEESWIRRWANSERPGRWLACSHLVAGRGHFFWRENMDYLDYLAEAN